MPLVPQPAELNQNFMRKRRRNARLRERLKTYVVGFNNYCI